jgi:hypothetical protein
MSFEQKYLKYKSKYLALKSQSKNIQKGGAKSKSQSFYGHNILDLDNLSVTPSMIDMYGYNLVGGLSNTKKSDIKKLSKLLTKSTNLTGGSDDEFIDSSRYNEKDINNIVKNHIESDIDDPENLIVVPATTPFNNDSDDPENLIVVESATDVNTTDVTAKSTDVTDESAAAESTSKQTGGKKKNKSNKKYFFDDSEFDLKSTTSESELSPLKSDSDSDSESDI